MKQIHLVDSHCHLQDSRIYNTIDAILSRAFNSNVHTLLCCGSETTDWETVKQLSSRYPGNIIPAFGIHPWYTDSTPPNWLDILTGYLTENPSAPIGEIGLDQKYANTNFQNQQLIFTKQMELAAQFKRPISVHCVKAWHVLIPILKEFQKSNIPIQLHSYNGGAALVDQLLELNCFFSFSGSLTRSKNKKAHEAFKIIPIERILLETDAPDIPLELNGQIDYDTPNEPANLFHILNFAASLRDMEIGSLASQLLKNAENFLRTSIPHVNSHE